MFPVVVESGKWSEVEDVTIRFNISLTIRRIARLYPDSSWESSLVLSLQWVAHLPLFVQTIRPSNSASVTMKLICIRRRE